MQSSRKPGASSFNRAVDRGSIARRRPFAILGALLALCCAYCDSTVGGNLTNVATPNPDGTPCNNNVECASYSCVLGACSAPTGGLVEIDGLCNGGETCVGDASCQDGICVANSLSCIADGTQCLTDDDCCKGDCISGYCGGMVGAGGSTGSSSSSGGSCMMVGGSCNVDSDCCSGNPCDMNSSMCSNTCAPNGEGCNQDTDCCSSSCETADGTCI